MQVRAGADRHVQRVGPDRAVRPSDGAHEAELPQGPDGGGPGAVPAGAVLLHHGQVRRPGVHDPADLGAGPQQRVPDGVRAHGCAQGVQGPRAERAGERARRLPPRRHLLRRRARLALAHRQGLVIAGSPFFFTRSKISVVGHEPCSSAHSFST
jgi:hypothetical protein